jgi:hypothetical protein
VRGLAWLLAAAASAAAISAFDDGTRAAIHVSVHDQSGLALEGARVQLTGQSVPVHRNAETDSRGQAAFTDLPEGTFIAAAGKSGFVTRAFGQTGGLDAVPIALAADDTFHAQIVLPRPGNLSGVIADEEGRPVRAMVQAYRRHMNNGVQTLMSIATAHANAQGVYVIEGLLPLDYLVKASGDLAATLSVFHPATTDPFDAIEVRVRPGETTYGVDVRLQSGRPGRIEAIILDANGQPSPRALVHLARTRGDLEQLETLVRSDGAGVFRREVPPGTYRIRTDQGGQMEVTVASGGVTSITVAAQPPARVSGRIEWAGTASPGSLPAGTMIAELIARLGEPAVPVRIADVETWRIRPIDVPPGDYAIRLSPALAGWSLESIFASKRLADRLHVKPGEPIDDLVLTVTDRATTLSGSVVDQQGAPRFDRRILVFAAAPAWWGPGSRRVVWAQPDTRGRFVVQGLPAGDYLIAAVADASGADWNRALLESAAPSAIPVSLGRGATVVQHVMIAR